MKSVRRRPRSDRGKTDQWHIFHDKAYRIGDFSAIGDGYSQKVDSLMTFYFTPPSNTSTCTMHITANWEIGNGEDAFYAGWKDAYGRHTLLHAYNHYKRVPTFEEKVIPDAEFYQSFTPEQNITIFEDALMLDTAGITGMGETLSSISFPFSGGKVEAWLYFVSGEAEKGGEGVVVSQFSLSC